MRGLFPFGGDTFPKGGDAPATLPKGGDYHINVYLLFAPGQFPNGGDYQ
jgi:hypothetical protein